jgi:Sec-independent protein translocase protein TatA
MLNISVGEILVVVCVACLVFKPEELPALANKLGQFVANARNKLTELRGLFLNDHG